MRVMRFPWLGLSGRWWLWVTAALGVGSSDRDRSDCANGGKYSRHCKVELRKHVLPRL